MEQLLWSLIAGRALPVNLGQPSCFRLTQFQETEPQKGAGKSWNHSLWRGPCLCAQSFVHQPRRVSVICLTRAALGGQDSFLCPLMSRGNIFFCSHPIPSMHVCHVCLIPHAFAMRGLSPNGLPFSSTPCLFHSAAYLPCLVTLLVLQAVSLSPLSLDPLCSQIISTLAFSSLCTCMFICLCICFPLQAGSRAKTGTSFPKP